MPLPLAVPIGIGAAGLFGQVFGGIKSGQAAREAEGIIQGQVDDLTAWYDTEKNRDFLQSNLGRSVINRVLENIEDQSRGAESAAAITGASDASKIAAKAKGQEQFSDVVKDLASYGTARQDRIEDRYRSNLTNLLGQQTNLALGRAQNAANLLSSAGQLYGPAGELFGLTSLGGAGKVVGGALAGANPNLLA